MTPTMTRRELLQWLGGATAGLVLSPAPFALIDDLTIATQTRLRPHGLPEGSLDRFRTRCPGCPAGCDIDVLRVGNQPYLCVPAAGAERVAGCAVLPALHQLRLHRRLTEPHLHGRRSITIDQARAEAMRWVESTTERSAIACLDCGPAGRGDTPLSVLADSIDGAFQVSGPAPRAPLGELARRLALQPDQELALDPSRIRRIVAIGPDTRPGDAAMRQLVRLIAGEAGRDDRGTVVLTGRDGVGSRLDPAVEHIATEANLALSAVGDDGPIVVRQRLTLGSGNEVCLDSLDDHSLSLLFVDASRPWQVIPWLRLRRKLIPGQGRLIVFTPWADASLEHADLVLPTAAPLEIEEFVGGDDRHPELRLALSQPLGDPDHPLCDPLQLAREFDPDAREPLQSTARALIEVPGGSLVGPDSRASKPAPAEPDALIALMRRGYEWRGPTLAAPQLPVRQGIPATGVASTAAVREENPRLRIEAPIFAGAGIPLPPVLAKLSSESRLVAPAGTARVHPRTLSRFQLQPDSHHRLRTNRGEIQATLLADISVELGTFVVMSGFDAAGFADEFTPGPDPLGHVDIDPRHDRPEDWVLEEVV